MMMLLVRLAAVAAVHLAFFAFYPDTGPAGNWYLWVSLPLWAVFIVFISAGAGLIKFVSRPAGALVNFAALGLMAFVLAATLPQQGGVSPLKRLKAGELPRRADLRSALRRVGLKGSDPAGELKDEVRRGAKKALKKLK